MRIIRIRSSSALSLLSPPPFILRSILLIRSWSWLTRSLRLAMSCNEGAIYCELRSGSEFEIPCGYRGA